MMPVEQLPPASALAALSLGFISAVFDNIPLTALALKQGGYDWGVLAYAVGFGGSMIWFDLRPALLSRICTLRPNLLLIGYAMAGMLP